MATANAAPTQHDAHTHRIHVMRADPAWTPSAEKQLPDFILVRQEDVACDTLDTRVLEILGGEPDREDPLPESTILHRGNVSVRLYLDEGVPETKTADVADFVKYANEKNAGGDGPRFVLENVEAGKEN